MIMTDILLDGFFAALAAIEMVQLTRDIREK